MQCIFTLVEDASRIIVCVFGQILQTDSIRPDECEGCILISDFPPESLITDFRPFHAGLGTVSRTC